jgi:tripartite-type tricarboxylate transporter receptor subunit TctC
MKRLLTCIALIASCVMGGAAMAQTGQPITVVVPYPPGGSDVQLRIVEDGLTKLLGQSIVIENKPGAGGAIGAQAVQRAKPDGNTLLLASTSVLAMLPNLQETSFTVADFVPVASLSATPLIVAAREGVPYRNIAELISYAKENPGKVLMASGGAGTSTHIVGEALQVAAGVKFRHVPFTGIAPAVTALLSGTADIVIGLPAPILPHLQSGKLIALASTGTVRSEFVPDVPTLKEAGFSLIENTRFGFFAPAGTPADFVSKFADAAGKVLNEPETVKKLSTSFSTASFQDPATFANSLKEEAANWARLFATPEFEPLRKK